MRSLICLALLVGVTGALSAQQSAYQDADGNSSIYLMSGNGNLTYNVSDTKFTAAFVRLPEGNKDYGDGWWRTKFVGGVNFAGKPSSDLTSQIFQSGNSPESISGGGVIGIHKLGMKLPNFAGVPPIGSTVPPGTAPPETATKKFEMKDNNLLLNVNFTKSTFNTIAANATAPTAQHFNGFTVMPTLNMAFEIPGFNFLIGAAGGASQVNNVDKLTQVSIQTTQSQSGSVTVVQSKTAYLGDYATAWNVPIYSDFVFIPKGFEWLSFDAFERANLMKTDQYTEGGFGIFIAQPSNATKVLGGVSLGWKNGARTVAIVGGWTF
jgi:hypothetical protein